MNLTQRPRRLRGNETVRKLVRETRMSPDSLVYPIFVEEGTDICTEIQAMPGQYRYSVDRLDAVLNSVVQSGVSSILLFGIPLYKDACGSGAWDANGIVQQAIRYIKKNFPSLYIITDVCLCEYTSHGHCGVLTESDPARPQAVVTVDNDKTLELLAKTALSHVEAGADMVAPSDMMDGRVGRIRQELDAHGYTEIPIMAYSAKYASAFYGPFREAAGSTPAFGDRKTYQMDPHNAREALHEAELDLQEGADIIMVKPGLPYLDIIRTFRDAFNVPIAAYSVSGEYTMLKAAGAAGYLDEAACVCESAVSLYRAGAQILITYYARELAGYIQEGRLG